MNTKKSKTNLLIRPYKKTDLDPYAKLSYQLNILEGKWDPDLIKTKINLKNNKKAVEEEIKEGYKVFLSEIEGKVIGFISFKFRKKSDEYKSRKYIWIARLFVLPEYRKTGVGKKLVDTVEKYAKDKSIKEINLNITEKNEKVFEFYTSINYKSTERIITKEIK